MLHFIWSIIIGFIAGFVASHLLGSHFGLVGTIVLGVIGSIVGGLIARVIFRPAGGATFHPAGLLLSIVGAVLALFTWSKIV